MRTALIIPAFNEAKTIRDLVFRAARQCELVVVVDDGSDDGTGSLVGNAHATVLTNRTRMGKAASLWRGIAYVLEKGVDAIITMDGDGQHSPEEIPALVSVAVAEPHGVILAARLRERHCMPPARRFGNGMADFWISWAAGQPIRDTQSGFRLYPAGLLETLDIPYDAEHGFVFESEVLIEAAWLGYPVMLVPVNCVYGDRLRPSHYRAAMDTLRIIRMVAWRLLRRGMYPLGLLRSVGVLTALSTRIDDKSQ